MLKDKIRLRESRNYPLKTVCEKHDYEIKQNEGLLLFNSREYQ